MGRSRSPSSSRPPYMGGAAARTLETPASSPSSATREIDRTLRAEKGVTLVVYGWQNAQPGTLSWRFPNARQALQAVRALRNAERWAVLAGVSVDVEAARNQGDLLFEASL